MFIIYINIPFIVLLTKSQCRASAPTQEELDAAPPGRTGVPGGPAARPAAFRKGGSI